MHTATRTIGRPLTRSSKAGPLRILIVLALLLASVAIVATPHAQAEEPTFTGVAVLGAGQPGVCATTTPEGACFTNEASTVVYYLQQPTTVGDIQDLVDEAAGPDVNTDGNLIVVSGAETDAFGDLLRAATTVRCEVESTSRASYRYQVTTTNSTLRVTNTTTCSSLQRSVATSRVDHFGVPLDTRADDDRDSSTGFAEATATTNAPVLDDGLVPIYYGPGSSITFNGESTFVNFEGDLSRFCYRATANVGLSIDGGYVPC